jgi:hypothetical protein
MKCLPLVLTASLLAAATCPAFSGDSSPAQDGYLTYSGNFLTLKEGKHYVRLTTDGRQRVFVSSIWPDGWMGLHGSDQIERVDGQPVRWVGQFVSQLREQAGPVTLTVYHHDIDMRVYEKREVQLARADYAKFIPADGAN